MFMNVGSSAHTLHKSLQRYVQSQWNTVSFETGVDFFGVLAVIIKINQIKWHHSIKDKPRSQQTLTVNTVLLNRVRWN